ncbi:hypothetical protein ACOME3_009510 [Neoechinorhynchus agilis]
MHNKSENEVWHREATKSRELRTGWYDIRKHTARRLLIGQHYQREGVAAASLTHRIEEGNVRNSRHSHTLDMIIFMLIYYIYDTIRYDRNCIKASLWALRKQNGIVADHLLTIRKYWYKSADICLTALIIHEIRTIISLRHMNSLPRSWRCDIRNWLISSFTS